MLVDGVDFDDIDDLADCDLSEFQTEPDNVSDLCTEIEDISGTEVVDKQMIYPCVMVDGVSTAAEVKMFQQPVAQEDEVVALPLYIRLEQTPVQIGMFPLSLERLLLMKFLGGYTLTLCRENGDQINLDFLDPEQLLKFIRI